MTDRAPSAGRPSSISGFFLPLSADASPARASRPRISSRGRHVRARFPDRRWGRNWRNYRTGTTGSEAPDRGPKMANDGVVPQTRARSYVTSENVTGSSPKPGRSVVPHGRRKKYVGTSTYALNGGDGGGEVASRPRKPAKRDRHAENCRPAARATRSRHPARHAPHHHPRLPAFADR